MSSLLAGESSRSLVCPRCRTPLPVPGVADDVSSLECPGEACGLQFPVVNGRPVLIDELRSLFKLEDYQRREMNGDTSINRRGLAMKLAEYVPSITRNWRGERNYRQLAALLETLSQPRVLIIGAGDRGFGADALLAVPGIELVRTDVYIGDEIDAVVDAHDLPFANGSFDAVVIQAVLEHVLDPVRCVGQIHRVLKPEGLVYAETPFLWPVHLGGWDFCRFSAGAHRRVFRHFGTVDAGILSGPGSAAALSIRGLFLSLSGARLMSAFVVFVLPFLIFWLKYLDALMLDSPRATDYSAAFYFLGRRAESPLDDRQLIAQYGVAMDQQQ
jgi:SAM-dependent methyltransferase/uncharacterized protein YbaR (Trm112 family)